MRRVVLAEQPICAGWPIPGSCRSLAAEVDHITNEASGGTDERSNLQGLCAPCHERKTQAEAKAAQRQGTA